MKLVHKFLGPLCLTVFMAPYTTEAQNFSLTSLSVIDRGTAISLNETVSTGKKQYSANVEHDSRTLSVVASWSSDTCNGHDQSGCGTIGTKDQNGVLKGGTGLYAEDPRLGFTKFNCPNCPSTSYPVTRIITMYERARTYWSDNPDADKGYPNLATPIRVHNGQSVEVDSGGLTWKWLVVRVDYEIHFDYYLSGWYWVGTSTVHKSNQYSIRIKRGDDPDAQTDLPRIKVDKRSAVHREGLGYIDVMVKLTNDKDSRTDTVTVDWTTEDQSGPLKRRSGSRTLTANAATAGSDYKAASGTLSFAPGEKKKDIRIEVLEDSMDEASEYFKISYSNIQGAEFFNGRDFTWGIIWNDDPIPGEWLSRFGESVGSQVVDAVSGRFDTGSQSGTGVWSHASYSGFTAGDETSLDGKILTGTIGADTSFGRVTAGLALSLSDGEGGFNTPGTDQGSIRGTLATVSPYAKVDLSDRLLVWGLAGLGSGDVTVVTGGVEHTSDTSVKLGAMGAKYSLVEQGPDGGMSLSWNTDALFVKVESERTLTMAATESSTSRVRTLLEGRYLSVLSDTRMLEPSFTLGVYRNKEDYGAEVGAGVEYSDIESGLSVGGSARALVSRDNISEWSLSMMAQLSPERDNQGPALSLSSGSGSKSLGVNLGYGIAVSESATLTPFMEAGQRVRVGARFKTHDSMLTTEFAREQTVRGHALQFGLSVQF